MISILSKSFTSTIYDVFFVIIIVFLSVSIVMWVALPIVLLSIRNELKRLNQTIKDYIYKRDIGT
ncbi:MAG: hypothetical protein ACPLW6_01825 [Desulfurella sp.]|jgi:cell division protein FtsL|uniref:Uncharacterized protein n=1 Tax=Desulfurella multipotens TaxID=79269 RepID=A0A1G6KTC9_9BACT|nr:MULTISPECIES: hypothetical protein [Desulfurella]AHF97749.1 hypothetical protein DESACE_02355 [Desulfurella acetivorans A63]PMP87432.1 MAG: hypothetical protein C0173_09130 [Desulfurella sp.]SDC34203.1 hypothetical protein SAMN05660835_00685 [Desulfurella multipotens]HEX13601.1 hypothetical protein [Desulfurella acetivorans]